MRKVYNYIKRIIAITALYALSSFSSASGQSLNVFILYGENAVSYVEACQGSTVAMTVEVFGGTGSGLTYTWSGDTNPLYFVDLGDLVSYKNTTPAGTYNLTVDVEDDGVFTGSASVTVVILPGPLANIVANGSTTFCEGGFVELEETNAQIGVTYQWQKDFSNISGATNYSYNAYLSGNYRIRVTGSNGCSKLSNTISINVNALPVITLNAFADVCVDAAPVSLSGGSPAGGTYSGTGVSGGNFDPSVAGVGTHTITYTYTDGNGCTNSATNTITVNALPSVILNAFADVCVDAAPFALSGGSPGGGTYSGTGVSGGNFDPSVAGVGTHTITYTYTDGNGCTNSTTNTITVNALPVVTLGAFANACVNASPFALSGGNPTGGAYSGTGVSGGNFDPSVAGVGTHTITYTYTDGNGCTNSANNTITVDALPAVTLGAFADLCVLAPPFALSGGNPAGGTYSGTGVSGGNFNPSVAGVGTHTITYTYTDGNGCTNSATNTITVNAQPVVTLNTFADVCVDAAPFALSGGNPAGGTYSGTGVSGGNFDPSVAGVGTHTITYTYTDGNGCTNSANNTITVNPLPSIYNVTGGGTYCAGDVGALVGLDDSDSGVTYTLYLNGVATTTTIAGTGSAISFGPQTTGTYTVYAKIDATGCIQAMSGSAVVSQIPAITGNTISSNQTICSGTAPAQLTGPIPSGGSGSYSYRWQRSTTAVTGPFSNITGATGQNYSPSALTQTTYYRRVVTSGSCISISNVLTITVNPVIANNTITADQAICYNTAPNQLAGSTPTGGNGTYTYIWQRSTAGSTGPFSDVAGATAINYQPGNLTQDTWYRRIVTSLPCSDHTSNVIKITVSPEFTVSSFTTTEPTCHGYSNGSATANLTGGTAPYSYSWNTSPGQTTQTATNLSAGVNYTVTVTDASGCMATGNVTLTEPAAIGLGSLTVTSVTGCFGDSNGAIQIDATGGTPNYTYSLYSGTTLISANTPAFPSAANFTGLMAGTYSVTITDVNSCPSYTEGNIAVTEPNQLVISDIQTTPISCTGSTDGTITVTASGGTGALEYSIDGITYQASNVFTIGEGYYDVSVRDANGCIATWPTQIVMVEPSEISFNYEITNITTCNGDSSGKISISNVSGGSGTGYEYSIYVPEVWGSNSLFENLPGGSSNPYYIKVRDSHGCIETGNNGNPIYINQPNPITFNVVTTDVTTCWYNTNGTIKVNTVAGGTGSKQVSIDGITYYPTTKTFTVGVGAYTVYVRDANGCIATKPAVISGPPAIVVDAVTVTDASCFGAADGSFDASASGGNPPLEYSIDGITYQAGSTFSGLSAATYTLYVRDLNGCVLNQDVAVGQPAALYFTTQQATDITCNGLTNGEITLVAAGGNAPYNYSITGGAPFGSTTGVFTGLSAGNYTAAVQDSKGCSTIGNNLTIVEPAAITITDQSSADILCFGETNGTVTVHASGGTTPLVYNLLDAGLNVIQTNGTGDFSGLPVGTYTVEVDDANSCGPISAGPFTVNEPSQLSFTYTTTDLTCHGDASGSITVNVLGGTPPYEYSYDGGATFGSNSTQGGLSGNDYTVIVRDANGCTTTQVINVFEPDLLTISLAVTNISCNGLTNGQIVATAAGGIHSVTTPYQYRINGGTWQLSGTFNGLSAGNYFIEVIDANGCITGDNAIISEPASIVINSTVPVNPTCTTLGSITVTASGGTGTLTYTLNPLGLSNTTGVFNNLGAGSYTVDVTDDNACGPVSTGNISLTSPSTITIDGITVTNVTGCYGNTNGSIEIQASGGTPPLSYSIDGGTNYQASNIFSGLPAGNYAAVVNDINDCPQGQPVTITEPAPITIDNVTVVQESTPGNNDGEIHVSASGGTGVLTYTLQPNAIANTTGDFTGLGTGTYHVEVTDANGCLVQTSDIAISGVDVSIIPTDVKCNGNSDGTIKISITGGFSPFTVICTRVSDSQPFPVTQTAPGEFFVGNLNAGIYIISITDATPTPLPNRQVIISEPGALTATYVDVQNPTCNGLSNGSITFDIDGGTPYMSGTDSLYTIEWISNGTVVGTVVDTVATGVAAGVQYEFRITDQNGCSITLTDVPVLTEPTAIQLLELTQFDPTCNGEAIGLINVTATGGSEPYQYALSGTKDTTNTTGVFDNLPAGVYDLSITDANGCPANLDPPVRITLSEPTPIVITGLTPEDSLTCPNDPSGYVRISVSGGQPDYEFLWSNGQTTADLENVVTGDYIIKVTDALSCTVRDTFTVKGPKMLELTPYSIDSALCRISYAGVDQGQITLLNSTGGNGSFSDLTFEWNDKNGTQGPVLTNVSAGVYTVTVTDTSYCVYTEDFEVPIKPRYSYYADAGSDTTVCYDNPAVLYGNVTGGDPDLSYTYEWYEIPNTAGDPISEDRNLQVQLTESKSYLLRITDSDHACIDTSSVYLGVYPDIGLQAPLYIAAVKDTIISVILGKEFNMDVITKSVEYETTFEWKPAEMFDPSDSWNSTLYLDKDVLSQIGQNYNPPRIVELQDPITKRLTNFILVDVIATTEKGCTDSIRLYTKVVDNLAFGNVFSPNGDGINDIWSVPKDYLFPDLEIEIFNRWGSRVWSAKGDKAARGWNGKTNNGKELPIGTYYYVVKLNAKAQGSSWKPVTGSVTIVK